jgi:hypothetical protein
VAARRLAGESLGNVPPGPLRLAIDCAVLAPGTGLVARAPAAPTLLIVERGAVLTLASHADTSDPDAPRLIAAAGDASALLAARSEVRNAGDEAASLVLVSLVSTREGPSPQTPRKRE